MQSCGISQIGEELADKSRACGLHWYNPAHLIPLVEVVPSAVTPKATVEELSGFIAGLGKKPVVCKESPGFIGVRLQAALVSEAFRMLEEGLATPEDIDSIFETFKLRIPDYQGFEGNLDRRTTTSLPFQNSGRIYA